MKEGWEYKKLGEVAEVIHGKNQKDVLSEGGQYPIYGSGGNIMGYANDYLCEAGTTILGRKGSINNPQFIEERFWNVDTAFGISAKEGYDSKFVYYFITSINWLKKNTGTTLPSLTQQVVKSVELPIPSFSEQQSIVDYLDSAFAKIDAMKANAEKALNEAKALFQASLKEMLEPKEGWEEKTINDVVFFRNGIAHEKDIEDSGDYVVINSKFVATGGTIRKYSNEQLSPLYINEIVMVMSDVPKGKTLAKCYIIECNNKYSLNQRICAFKSKGLDVKFLYYLLNRNPHLLKYDNGENQTNLRKKQILECPLTFPSQKNEQQRIVICLDSLKSKVDRLQENYDKISQECDALKQAILRQVFE